MGRDATSRGAYWNEATTASDLADSKYGEILEDWWVKMWHLNNFYEENVTAWNEEDAVFIDGGKSLREKSDDVTMSILTMKEGSMFFYEDEGRFQSDGIVFQVSKAELEKLDFSIKSGNTHIEKDGNTYRVMEVVDYRRFILTQLIECKCVKIMDVD